MVMVGGGFLGISWRGMCSRCRGHEKDKDGAGSIQMSLGTLRVISAEGGIKTDWQGQATDVT